MSILRELQIGASLERTGMYQQNYVVEQKNVSAILISIQLRCGEAPHDAENGRHFWSWIN
uniref:Uncharacterized protein n=1 Tax=Anaerobacillus isosaccharinicus TaxID=1532552 RepID=A0A1S2MDC4_9BACI